MNPLFKTGDILYIEKESRLSPGDVVVYSNPLNGSLTVHRIIFVREGSYITRGDNNLKQDPCPIDDSQIKGRVVAFSRGEKKILLKRGRKALFHSKKKWYLKKILRFVRRIFAKLFRRIYFTGTTFKILNLFYRGKILVVEFKDNSSSFHKYVVNGRTVAAGIESQGIFFCRKPYDLIIPGRYRKHGPRREK